MPWFAHGEARRVRRRAIDATPTFTTRHDVAAPPQDEVLEHLAVIGHREAGRHPGGGQVTLLPEVEAHDAHRARDSGSPEGSTALRTGGRHR